MTSTTIVLIKPLSSRIGMPSDEVIRQIFSWKYRLVVLDPEIDRELAQSSYNNPVFKGYREANALKEESKLNPLLYMFAERPYYWDYKLGDGLDAGDDIRDFDSKIIYIDCTKTSRGSLPITNNLSDELHVMSLVEDFKTENRGYYRIDENQINDILLLANKTDELYNIYSGDVVRGINASRAIVDVKILMEALHYYLINDFHKEEKELPLYMSETDIYNKPGNPNWCMNMNTPALKGIVRYYGILPDIPSGDRQALISTGKTPTTMMATSGQYRQVVTKTLTKIMSNFVVNNNMHSGFNENQSIDWEDAGIWLNILENL